MLAVMSEPRTQRVRERSKRLGRAYDLYSHGPSSYQSAPSGLPSSCRMALLQVCCEILELTERTLPSKSPIWIDEALNP